MQLYSPKSIANYFIERAKASGEQLSPLKLQNWWTTRQDGSRAIPANRYSTKHRKPGSTVRFSHRCSCGSQTIRRGSPRQGRALRIPDRLLTFPTRHKGTSMGNKSKT